MRIKLTYFKNDYDNDDEPPDKFKNLDPRRAELAGKNPFMQKLQEETKVYIELESNRAVSNMRQHLARNAITWIPEP